MSVTTKVPRLFLAPMQDVSVLPVWRVLEEYGGPDIYVTEYFRVHPDSRPEKPILRSIIDGPADKPIVAQMIGNDTELLKQSAVWIQNLTPCSGIDINLGCPAPKVCGKQSGGALLRDLGLIRRIAETLAPVVEGTFSLKTRVGFENDDEFDALLDLFAELPLSWLAIHGRTVRDKYQSSVHTSRIAEAVHRLPYPVIANGSVVCHETAAAMTRKSQAHGLMVGRGAIRNPWLFSQIRAQNAGTPIHTPTLRDLWSYLTRLAEAFAEETEGKSEEQTVHKLKKISNYIATGLADGAFLEQLRRVRSWSQFQSECQQFLDSDEAIPLRPVEDGRLFCGMAELLKP